MFMSVLVGVVFVDTWSHSHTPTLLSLSVLVGRNGFDQAPFAHPQLRRIPRSAHESQLTPRITNQMSSVRSPATDLRYFRHYFFCNRNATAWPIQIEEKALSINSSIVQRKERYFRPRVITVSITMRWPFSASVWNIRKHRSMNSAAARSHSCPPTCTCPAIIYAATGTPPSGRSKLRKRPSA